MGLRSGRVTGIGTAPATSLSAVKTFLSSPAALRVKGLTNFQSRIFFIHDKEHRA